MLKTTTSNKPWADKSLTRDILQPLLQKTGGPVGFSAVTGALSLPLWYLLARRLRPGKAPLLTALGGITTGLGAWYGSKPITGKYTDEDWSKMMVGMKTGSDDIFLAPMPIPYLHKAVTEMPGFGSLQKDFLHEGVATAPQVTAEHTHLEGLTRGFDNLVGEVTNNKVAAFTRAIEGALIGSAFSSLLGVSPGTKKWMTGVTAAADALYGNKLVKALGQFQ